MANQDRIREAANVMNLMVGDGCNPSGILRSFVEDVLPVIEEEARARGGTEWVSTHPLMVCLIDKLADLARLSSLTDKKILDAWEYVRRHTKKEEEG